jgi:hypothetical protein
VLGWPTAAGAEAVAGDVHRAGGATHAQRQLDGLAVGQRGRPGGHGVAGAAGVHGCAQRADHPGLPQTLPAGVHMDVRLPVQLLGGQRELRRRREHHNPSVHVVVVPGDVVV